LKIKLKFLFNLTLLIFYKNLIIIKHICFILRNRLTKKEVYPVFLTKPRIFGDDVFNASFYVTHASIFFIEMKSMFSHDTLLLYTIYFAT